MVSRNALIALAVLATGLAVAGGTAMAVSSDAPTHQANQTVSVAGTGEIDVEPDAAVVGLSVTATGQDAANVSDELAAGAAELRQTLTDFGVDSEDIQTVGYYVREQHERPKESNGPTRFVGEHSFEVTLSDVESVGALIDAAVQGGADDVDGVRYTLSDTKREEIRNDALRAAVDDARSEASVIADATGLELSEVLSARSIDSSVSPYRANVEMAATDSGGAGTQIESRDVTVTATVHVTFSATGA